MSLALGLIGTTQVADPIGFNPNAAAAAKVPAAIVHIS